MAVAGSGKLRSLATSGRQWGQGTSHCPAHQRLFCPALVCVKNLCFRHARLPRPAHHQTVWAEFHEELYRFVRRRVRDPDVTQDLLQEVFVKIHLRLATLTHAERLAAWVYQIARHTMLDYFRQRRPAAELPAGLERLLADLPAAPGADAEADFAHCLRPFVERLPAEYREALQLTELGALSQKEYAARLGLSYSGAKSRVQRARRQLRALFTACCHVSADAYGNILAARPCAPGGCAAVAAAGPA